MAVDSSGKTTSKRPGGVEARYGAPPPAEPVFTRAPPYTQARRDQLTSMGKSTDPNWTYGDNKGSAFTAGDAGRIPGTNGGATGGTAPPPSFTAKTQPVASAPLSSTSPKINAWSNKSSPFRGGVSSFNPTTDPATKGDWALSSEKYKGGVSSFDPLTDPAMKGYGAPQEVLGMDTSLLGRQGPASVDPMAKNMGNNRYTPETAAGGSGGSIPPEESSLVGSGSSFGANGGWKGAAKGLAGGLVGTAVTYAADKAVGAGLAGLSEYSSKNDKGASPAANTVGDIAESVQTGRTIRDLALSGVTGLISDKLLGNAFTHKDQLKPDQVLAVPEEAFYPKAADNGKEKVVMSPGETKIAQGKMGEGKQKTTGPAGWPGTTAPNMQAAITPQFESGLGAPQGRMGQDQSAQPRALSTQRPAMDPYQPAQTHSERLSPLVDQVMLGKSNTVEGLQSRDALMKELAKLDQQSGINQGTRTGQDFSDPRIDPATGEHPHFADDMRWRDGSLVNSPVAGATFNGQSMPTEFTPVRESAPPRHITMTDKNSKGQHVAGQQGTYINGGLVESPSNRGGYSEQEAADHANKSPYYVQSEDSIARGFTQSDGKGGPQVQYGAGGLVQRRSPEDAAEAQMLASWQREIAEDTWNAPGARHSMAEYLNGKNQTKTQAETNRQNREDTQSYNREKLEETRDYHRSLTGQAQEKAAAAQDAVDEKSKAAYNTTLNGIFSRLSDTRKDQFEEVERAVAKSGSFTSKVLADPQAAQAIYDQAEAQINAARFHNGFHPTLGDSWKNYFTEPRWDEHTYNPKLGTPQKQQSWFSDDNAGAGRYSETYRKAAGVQK